jgi:putative ABC transport system permease protein
MREILAEVFAVMKGNKLRIALTGLSIAWGIFIFIVLISAGRGLLNGMNYNFRVFNVGVMTLTPNETSLPFEGRRQGRAIHFYEEDAAALDSLLGDTVVKAIPVVSHAVLAHRGKESASTIVEGYTPGYAVAPNTRIVEGRDINDIDMLNQRKVCVIPKVMRDVFFRDNTASVLGNTIQLDGINFLVIGVYEPVLESNPMRAIVVPLNTVKKIWCPDGKLSRISLQTAHLTTAALNEHFNARLLSIMASRKAFSPADKQAIKIHNLYEEAVLVSNILAGLRIFVIVVALATLISGIVGVSNIMHISVRERTREIGVRRAIGSKARQIVVLVLAESVVICLLSGYLGMFLGIGVMELAAKLIDISGNSNIFNNPTVSLDYVLIISCIMVVAGLMAGYVPAKQAANTKLVEAMKDMLTASTRSRQRLMTAFGVFWGILILTLLIGSGMGLDNGIVSKLNDIPPNEMWIKPHETTMPYQGFGRGRKWQLNTKDEELIRQHFSSSVVSYSAICYAGYQNVVRGERAFLYQVTGVVPQFVNELPQRVTEGRFINDLDMNEHRKVCVIGEHVADAFFANREEAVGSTLKVNGMLMTVVGVTHCTNPNIYIGVDLAESVLMPLPTQQTAYGRGDDIDLCSVIMNDEFPMEQQKEQVIALVKENHAIHPDDQLAITVEVVSEIADKYYNATTGTHILIWIVGLGTLMAGLIGITNIMLVTVKERTQEIGIRRAIGAKPIHIVRDIMQECLVLTLSAGLTGLCVAVWLLHVLEDMLPQGDDVVFSHPSIPFWTAITALLILVAGGLLAGWMPVRRALDILPVDALRDE